MTENIYKRVKEASRKLVVYKEERINQLLISLSEKLLKHTSGILAANKKDLERMDEADPRYDRLQLTAERLTGIAADLVSVSNLPSPLGHTLEKRNVKSGLLLEKLTVPLGVVGVVYEARPNVTFDVFALCIKSGNACILKGGSDARFSNHYIAELIRQTLLENDFPENAIALLSPDRESTTELLNATEFVDVIIPRGSQGLIDYVRQHSRVPVIETGAGIVHTYFDISADTAKGKRIIENAKTRRVSVCNALDCLIVHRSRLDDLASLVGPLEEKRVVLYADEASYSELRGKYAEDLLEVASPGHYGNEFLDYKMSIRTVNDLDEALDHISRHSSRHSEAIIAEDESVISRFLNEVDAAAVYANASTAFTDGGQFGLGAEIGISTQKLHARGPMGLRELTSYKWVIRGDGAVRTP